MTEANDKESQEFDWVTRRYECSLPIVFRQLRKSVKADVATRNSLRSGQPTYEFVLVEEGNTFSVVLEGQGVRKQIGFSLAEHAIIIKDDKGYQMFDISVKFNDQGECKMLADNEHRSLWEIRRMALEELFFRAF